MGGTDKTSWIEGMEPDEEGAFTDEDRFPEPLAGWSGNTRADAPEGKTVAAPMPLPSQSVIPRSKNTQGRFVATCSNAYEWSDMAEDGTS